MSALVTSNVWERVLRIESAGSIGTGTVIEDEHTTYCVTAKHVLPPPGTPLTVSSQFTSVELTHDPIPGIADDVDIAVFPIPDEFARPGFPLPIRAGGLALSQDVFFLGYPYGLSMVGGGMDNAPFVKRATVDTMTLTVSSLR